MAGLRDGCHWAAKAAGLRIMDANGIKAPMYCCEVRWRELRRFCESALEPSMLSITEKKTTSRCLPRLISTASPSNGKGIEEGISSYGHRWKSWKAVGVSL